MSYEFFFRKFILTFGVLEVVYSDVLASELPIYSEKKRFIFNYNMQNLYLQRAI